MLHQAYQQNQQIQKAASDAAKAEQELDELRHRASQVAFIVQRTVQAFEAVSNINELYLCDD